MHHRLGHDGVPHFGVLDAQGLAADGTHEGEMLVADLAARGAEVTVGGWGELALDGKTLRLRGAPVTCLLFYGQNQGDYELVARARRAGAAWTVLGLRNLLANSKVIPALLSDPAERVIDPDLAAAAARHLPWSRLVVPGATDFHGTRIDLLSFVALHPERFALKPAHGSAGAGILLGWNTAPAAWEVAVGEATRRPYVVQERVELPVERFPVVEGEHLTSVELRVDLNPLIWSDGTVEGAFVRATRSELLGLGSGRSGTTPLWVIEGKRAAG
jgi:hypothetical protein